MKPGYLLPIISWASLFVLIWLVVLKVVLLDGGNTVALVFFFVIAAVSTSVSYSDAQEETQE